MLQPGTTLTHLTKFKTCFVFFLFQIRPTKLNIILRPGNSWYRLVINVVFPLTQLMGNYVAWQIWPVCDSADCELRGICTH